MFLGGTSLLCQLDPAMFFLDRWCLHIFIHAFLFFGAPAAAFAAPVRPLAEPLIN